MTRIFAVLIAVLFISTAKADCLACWELRKVKITLTNGDTVTGFVQWNEIWLADMTDGDQWVNKFPESLIFYYCNLPYDFKIVVAKNLVTIKNDSLPEIKATTPDNLLKLDYSEIKKIVEIDNKLEKYNGAGEIPTFSREDFVKLQSNPYAKILIDAYM